MKRLLFILLFSSLGFGQGIFIPARTVTGTVNGSMRPIAGATITVCAANRPGIPCSPALANTVFQDSALTVPLSNPFTTDANGNYPQAALAGGIYTITESASGFAGFSYQVSVACAPGAGCSISGPLTVGGTLNANNLNGTFWYDINPPFAGGCPAAVTAAGTSNGSVVTVPGTGPIVDCPLTVPENVIIENWDRTREYCNGQVNATPPCLAINYGYDDTNVFAGIRIEMTTNHQDVNGVTLPFYIKNQLKNATANGSSGIDGLSTEANTAGTLSGTFAGIQAHEADGTIGSTGGTITDFRAVLGYMNSNVGSTTAVTNATGLYGLGCNFGHLLGTIPGNCYGAQFADQRGQAPGRNYSFSSNGVSLFAYSGNAGKAGFDCEDNGHTTRPCFYVDSTGAPGNRGILNIQAVSSDGIAFVRSTGQTSLSIDSISRVFITQSFNANGAGVTLGGSGSFSSLVLGSANNANSFTFTAGATAAARTVNIIDPGATTTLGLSYNSGSAVSQTKRFGSSCTTAASAQATCTSTFSWTTAFADASYTPICWGEGPSGSPILTLSSTQIAASITVQVQNAAAAASSFAGVYCYAQHD